MAVKIRLKMLGSANRRTFRVVIMDESQKRNGAVIEEVGFVNPLVKPKEVKLDRERIEYWQKVGARPTETVKKLLETK